MASILALISKAVFEKLGKRVLGERLGLDRYTSAVKALSPLSEGGALVLVTVRPGEIVWLCAILEDPTFDRTLWRAAAPSSVPLTDVTDRIPLLRLASGKGIQAPAGKLGMSLQTPRVLADADVALLRSAASGSAAGPPAVRAPAPARPPARTPARAPAPPAPAPPVTPAPAPVIAAGPDVGALHAGVLAAPCDDAPRRVLADRLIEAGDPQGEFIQLSCEAAPLSAFDPRRVELEERAATLLRRRGLAFSRRLRAVAPFNRSPDGQWSMPFAFERGFPDMLKGDAKELLPLVGAVTEVSPVCGLNVAVETPDELRALAALPQLADVRSLTLRYGWPAPDGVVAAVARLFESPHLARLERLELQGQCDAAVVEALAGCRALEGLRSLSMTFRSDARVEVDAVLRGACAPSLRTLHLSDAAVDAATLAGLPALEELRFDAPLGVAGARVLAERGPRTLRKLSTSGAKLGGPEGIAAIVRGAALASLEILELREIGASKGVARLAEALALPALQGLRLEGHVGPNGVESLVRAHEKLSRLSTLGLHGGKIGDAGARALSRLALPRLTTLGLSDNAIGASGMEALGEGPLLSTVRELNLRHNKCQNDGGLGLAKGDRLRQLRSISLNYNWMGVKGVHAILAAAPELEEFHTGMNNYGAEPMRFVTRCTETRRLRVAELEGGDPLALAKSPGAQTLERLTLEHVQIDAEAARALAALPVLDTLVLSFSSADAEGAAILRARFGPYLHLYATHGLDWDALPGPH